MQQQKMMMSFLIIPFAWFKGQQHPIFSLIFALNTHLEKAAFKHSAAVFPGTTPYSSNTAVFVLIVAEHISDFE